MKINFPGNLDFENLSQMLFNVWSDFGQDTDNYLNQTQLEIVCERVGLQKVGKKVAGEVFEKLGLNPNNRIGYNEFIALLHSDSDVYNDTLDQNPIVTSTDTNTVGTLDDSSGYDLHAHPGLLYKKKQFKDFLSSLLLRFLYLFFYFLFVCWCYMFVPFPRPSTLHCDCDFTNCILIIHLTCVVL